MAKVTKLKDRQNNEILPLTRATLVEMNNGISVQTAIDNINSAGYITSYTETDPTVPSYVKNITQADITNWNNKLDTFTETDPTIPSYVRGIKETDIAYWNDKEGKTVAYITEYDTSTPVIVGDTHDEAISKLIKIIDDNEYVTARAINALNENMGSYIKLTDIDNYGFVTQDDLSNAGYLQTFIETDPTVPSYVKGITQADITNWNNKADNALLVTLTGISSQNDQGWDNTIDGIYFTTDKTLSEINSASKVNVLIPAVIASQFDLGSSDIIVYPDASDIYQFFRSDTLINGYFWGSDGGYGRFYVEYIYSFVHKDAVKSDIDLYGGDVTNEQISNGWWVSQVPSVSVTYGGIQTLDNKIHRELSTSYVSKTELNSASYVSYTQANSYYQPIGNYLTEHQSLSSYATAAYYDSSARKIYLRHNNINLSEIDANDFIKDGMVDTAYVDGSYLVISFNTDAGKQPIEVPINDIFDPQNINVDTKNVVAATNSFITSTTTPLPNGNVYINHINNDTVKSSLKIYGSYGVNVVADASANISVEHATKGLLHNTFGYYAVKTDDYGHTTVGSQLSYQYINQITNFNYTIIKDTDINEFDSSILED